MRTPRLALLVALLPLLALTSRLLAGPVHSYRDKPDDWLATDEGTRVLTNILSWQTPAGGWWKSYDAEKAYDPATPREGSGRGTFDNNATWSELRLLARAFTKTQKPAYRAAFDRGLRFVLDAQYPNGGWPQQHPDPDGYAKHITFNDNAMTSVMSLLKDVADGKREFAFVDTTTRQHCRDAFDRGVKCILDCQIVVDDKLTVWCAQHDEKTLAPAKARTYELPSLSGGESAEIALLLMRIDQPSDAVKKSVHAAAAWFEASKLTGIRLEKRDGDTLVVEDPAAPPLWARFYDLETGRPFYCGRDGVKKGSLSEIDRERRNGYAWIRPFGQKFLDAYPKWAAKHGAAPAAIAGPASHLTAAP
jgi:pectinesterase